jgi:hypothetical protein
MDRRVRSGIIPTTAPSQYNTVLSLLFSEVTLFRYCDGLRGAIVVYDPLDPHRLLYDIDDGKLLRVGSFSYSDVSL